MPTTISGNTGVSQVQAGSITAADLDGAQTGSAPIYGCRAWVNFDGTKDTTGATSTANTNRLIRASGNVTSVLRNGTGDYTINLTTALPDTNACAVAGFTQNPSGTYNNYESTSVTSTSSCDVTVGIVTGSSSIAIRDSSAVYVAIFR